MKKVYVKPVLTVVELRPEERIGKRCHSKYTSPGPRKNDCIKSFNNC